MFDKAPKGASVRRTNRILPEVFHNAAGLSGGLHPYVASGVTAEGQDGGERGPDDDATLAEYQASRARYIRTITADVEQRVMATIGKRRAPLKEEIGNLALLGHARYEEYRVALKAYSARVLGRVTARGLLPPSPSERMILGIDKLYKEALRTAEAFREITTIVKKRKDKLEELDWKMRDQVEQYGRAFIRQLETPSGLEGAFKRDPLLGRAHARMLAAQSRRESVKNLPT